MECSNIEIEANWTWSRKHIQGKTKIVNLYYRKDLLDSIKMRLSKLSDDGGSVLSRFEQGPFGHLLKWKCGSSNCQALNALIGRQIRSPSLPEHQLWFRINDRNVCFSSSEFALVTGLRFGASQFNPCDTNHRASDTGVFKRFCGGKDMSLEQLWGVFRGSKKPKNATNDDFLKVANLLCLYLFAMGHDLRRKPDNFAWKLVDNLSAWNEFPWGAYCFKAFLHYFNGMKTTGEKYHLFGGAWSLQIWALEAIPALGTHVGKIVEKDITPRCLKWTFKKSRALDFHTLFKEATECYVNLLPTSTEKEQVYCTTSEDMSWLSLGYLKPVCPFVGTGESVVPDGKKRKVNSFSDNHEEAEVVEDMTAHNLRKRSKRVKIPNDSDDDLFGNPPILTRKRRKIDQPIDLCSYPKNHGCLVREERIVEKLVERVVPRLITYIKEHVAPDMISTLKSFLMTHVFQPGCRNERNDSYKVHKTSHRFDDQIIVENDGCGLENEILSDKQHLNHQDPKSPTIVTQPYVSATSPSRLTPSKVNMFDVLSSNLQVQGNANDEPNLNDNADIDYNSTVRALSVDGIDSPVRSLGNDMDVVNNANVSECIPLVPDEACTKVVSCEVGQFIPKDVLDVAEYPCDDMEHCQSPLASTPLIVRACKQTSSGNMPEAVVTNMPSPDGLGSHNEAKIHDTSYPTSPNCAGVDDFELDQLVYTIAEDVGIELIMDDKLDSSIHLNASSGLRPPTLRFDESGNDMYEVMVEEKLLSQAVENASPTDVCDTSTCLKTSCASKSVDEMCDDVGVDSNIVRPVPSLTHGDLECERLKDVLVVKGKTLAGGKVAKKLFDSIMTSLSRLHRHYDIVLIEEFFKWYDHGKHTEVHISKSLLFPWELNPKELIQPSWFKTLYSPRESISSSHCDALLNLLIYFRGENNVEYLFLDDWTFLESYATHTLMNSLIVSTSQMRYMMDHVSGVLPKQCPKSWSNVRKVYGIAHVEGNHWVLFQLCVNERSIIVFDTLGSHAKREKTIISAFRHMAANLPKLFDDCIKGPGDHLEPWNTKCVEHTPVQQNLHDCGVLAIKLMECLTTGQSFANVDPHICSTYRAAYCLDLFKVAEFGRP